MAVSGKKDASRLAIDGGKPVRKKPLPQEWCGSHYIDESEVKAVTRVIRSRSPFRYYGLKLQAEAAKLEKEFARYLGVKYALGLNSGTAALQVALAALGVGPGDEVLVPAYFWVSIPAAIVRSGAIPVLVDTDDTFSMDPGKIEAKITPRTRVILPVHMGGVIGRIEEMVAVARRHGLKVLEDCAQAAGAVQKGRKPGTFGDIAIFSFQLNKHMTSGEGGMLVTNDEALYKRAFAVHDLGYWRNEKGRLEFGDPTLQLWGIGARMSELTAAMARVQLKKLDRICKAMRNAKNRMKKAVAGIPGITPRRVLDPAGDCGSFLLLSFADRELSYRFLKALQAEGIQVAAGGLYPIHMEEWGLHIYYNNPSLVHRRSNSPKSVWDLVENAQSQASYGKGTCPSLDDLVSRTILLCVASNLTKRDVDDIIVAMKKVAAALL
ncbi:MAG: DegT/DnrJ/EryC1/StrS family aminotransferase [Planctomycetota bacterium]